MGENAKNNGDSKSESPSPYETKNDYQGHLLYNCVEYQV